MPSRKSKAMAGNGYFEIGIVNGKKPANIGTLWRSAWQLGAAGIFTVGKRYEKQASDTVGAPRKIPLRHFRDMRELMPTLPVGAVLVGIEHGGTPLASFHHPEQAVYLLGAEDFGLSTEAERLCHAIVTIEDVRDPSLNVAVAGSLVLWHRLVHPEMIGWKG